MAAQSPITNNWGKSPLVRLTPQEVCIFRAREGWAYNHHPQVAWMDGRLYATWSNGLRDEDRPGQQMLLATSDDLGQTWSPPRAIVPRPEHLGVCTSEGLHVHDGQLTAYCGYYDVTERSQLMYYATGGNLTLGKAEGDRYYTNVHTRILVSDDRGETWRQPAERIDAFIPNLGPHRLASGRLILPGAMRYPYTDDPAGVSGWRNAQLPRLGSDYSDSPEGFIHGRRTRGDETSYCEGSCFQTDDGVVHMMLRTGREQLAVSLSSDNGDTWSEPAWTGYTDCRCRFQFGRLPDGRFFGLNCPQPNSPRTPLVLALSDDGVVFGRHYLLGDRPNVLARIPGVHKYGRYGYASCHVAADTIFVVYSVNKEDIFLMRIALKDLS
jgi:hypothetical protein